MLWSSPPPAQVQVYDELQVDVGDLDMRCYIMISGHGLFIYLSSRV